MGYVVSGENFLTWILLKKTDGVSIADIKRLGRIAQEAVGCHVEASAGHVYAVVESSDIFRWSKDDKVIFAEGIDKEKLKLSLEYMLPEVIYDELGKITVS